MSAIPIPPEEELETALYCAIGDFTTDEEGKVNKTLPLRSQIIQ
jgi:hypothetical protein